jgi:predicted nuclease of predicted toxin-antitoxin system
MKIYLDEDLASRQLAGVLTGAGHDVEVPVRIGRLGDSDPVQLAHAIRESRIMLTRNSNDFEELHDLILASGGHHPGILVVRRENNPRRDMRPQGIARAIARIEASALVFENNVHIVNHWR